MDVTTGKLHGQDIREITQKTFRTIEKNEPSSSTAVEHLLQFEEGEDRFQLTNT